MHLSKNTKITLASANKDAASAGSATNNEITRTVSLVAEPAEATVVSK